MVVFATLTAAPARGQVELSWRVEGKAPERAQVTLSALEQVELVRVDLQYEREVKVKGVPLATLLERLPGDGDLVLAHFSNGMIVPLPDAKGMARLAPFVATSLWVEDGQGAGAWQALPPVAKKEAAGSDVRPIRFEGNKLIISERWHPAVPAKAQAIFAPWEHTNALTNSNASRRRRFVRSSSRGRHPPRSLAEPCSSNDADSVTGLEAKAPPSGGTLSTRCRCTRTAAPSRSSCTCATASQMHQRRG